MNNAQVPEKFSDLVALAVHDMRTTVLQNPNYIVDMKVYLMQPGRTAKCNVCFAGAVMAGTLGMNGYDESVFELTSEWNSAISSLNRVRMGDLTRAYELLNDVPGFDGRLQTMTETLRNKIPKSISNPNNEYNSIPTMEETKYFLTLMDVLIEDLRAIGM